MITTAAPVTIAHTHTNTHLFIIRASIATVNEVQMDKPFIKCTLNIQCTIYSVLCAIDLVSFCSQSNISIEALTLSFEQYEFYHSYSSRIDFLAEIFVRGGGGLLHCSFFSVFVVQLTLFRAVCRLNVVRLFRAHIIYFCCNATKMLLLNSVPWLDIIVAMRLFVKLDVLRLRRCSSLDRPHYFTCRSQRGQKRINTRTQNLLQHMYCG